MHLHHCVCCMCIVAGRGGVVNLCHCLFLRDVKVPAWNRPAPLSGYWIQDSFASPQIAFVVDYSVGCIDSLGYSRWPITFFSDASSHVAHRTGQTKTMPSACVSTASKLNEAGAMFVFSGRSIRNLYRFWPQWIGALLRFVRSEP